MFDEPEESPQQDRVIDPKQRALEKADEFRIHAEVAAVFEGPRKFEAEIDVGLSDEIARDVQKGIAKLERAKETGTPLIKPEHWPQVEELLKLCELKGLASNDYHIYRRPGEAMIVRWIEAEQVENFYERLQAHFDAAMEGFKEEYQQAHAWKQDEKTAGFLKALEDVSVKMEERYLRPIIRKHKVFVLSTLAADQMDILHLSEAVMGVDAAQLVGNASAPGENPTEDERAWFFKLFSLRGMIEAEERMLFFAYLQKTEEGW